MKKPRKQRVKYPKHDRIVRVVKFALVRDDARQDILHGVLDASFAVRDAVADAMEAERDLNRERKGRGEAAVWTSPSDWQIFARKWFASNRKPEWPFVHSHVLADVVDRLVEGTKRWFDALKSGRTNVNPPHAIRRKMHRSFSFKQRNNGYRIENNRIFLSKLGSFRLHGGTRIPGTPKRCSLKFMDGRWFVFVFFEIEAKTWFDPVDQTKLDVGCDPGLTHLLTDSHGVVHDSPRFLKEAQARLRHAQRDMSRKFEARKAVYAAMDTSLIGPVQPLRAVPHSHRLVKQIKRVAKLHCKVKNQRANRHAKIAAVLSDRYRNVACEEHGVTFMIRNRRLAGSASERGVAALKLRMRSTLGERYVAAPNRRPGIGGNSQTCVCDAPVPKGLGDRVHSCPSCGLVAGRDFVSANIVQHTAFGTHSPRMNDMRAARAAPSADGQFVVTRGDPEARRRESVPCESARTSEASVKREPSKLDTGHTTGGEPTVEPKTQGVEGGGLRPRPASPREGKTPVSSTTAAVS